MSARADLCGGRPAMVVPTATAPTSEMKASCRVAGLSDIWSHCRLAISGQIAFPRLGGLEI